MDTIVIEAADRLFSELGEAYQARDAAQSDANFDALYQAVLGSGFLDLLREPDLGGTGGSAEDLFGIAQLVGRHALALPIVETMVGRALLDACGQQVPDAPLAVAFTGFPGCEERRPYIDVPWAGGAASVVLVSLLAGQARVALLAAREDGFRNMAGEPEARIELTGLVPIAEAQLPAEVATRYFRLASLGQAAMIAGALDKVLAMSLQYVADRSIFGKRMKSFQVVQHQLAQMGEEACASMLAAQAAAVSFDEQMGPIMLASARARAADAVDFVGAASHQFHGAIGFTIEFPLQRWTKRLWAWRDQHGTAVEWRRYVGRSFMGIGADDLWAHLSGSAASTRKAG